MEKKNLREDIPWNFMKKKNGLYRKMSLGKFPSLIREMHITVPVWVGKNLLLLILLTS